MIIALATFAGCALLSRVIVRPTADTPRYFRLADNLLASGSFSSCASAPLHPEFERMPGYPVLLALVRLFGTESNYLIGLTQGLLHALTVYLVYQLAWALLEDARFALAAAIAWAVYPFAIYFALSIMSETLATTGMVATFTGIIVYLKSGRRPWLLVALGGGVIASYTRPNLLAVMVFLSFLALASRRRRRTRTTKVLLAFTGALLLLQVPWGIRNYVSFGIPMLGSHNFISANLCESAMQFQLPPKQLFEECFGNMPPDLPGIQEACEMGDNLRNDAIFKQRALNHFHAHPVASIAAAGLRPIRVWFTFHFLALNRPVLLWMARIGTIALLPLFVIGSVLLWRRTEFGWILAAVCLVISLQHIVLVVSARYSMPARPFYVIAVMYVIFGIARSWRSMLKRDWDSIRWPGAPTSSGS
jgi:4-amino-4-deoxy-L-arabinose transferase-like glycosyltransferase